MIRTTDKQYNVFDTISTYVLQPGIQLPKNVIYGAMLTPTVMNTGCGYISGIGMSPKLKRSIIEVSVAETVVCTGYFPKQLDEYGRVIINMFDNNTSQYCGVIVGNACLQGYAHMWYAPASNSLVFLPNVFRPIPAVKPPEVNNLAVFTPDGARVSVIEVEKTGSSATQNIPDITNIHFVIQYTGTVEDSSTSELLADKCEDLHVISDDIFESHVILSTRQGSAVRITNEQMKITLSN